MGTVLVTSRSFSSGRLDVRAQLKVAGHSVVEGDPRHRLPLIESELNRADAWIAGTGPILAEHLDCAPLLRVVARYGVGVDAVDRNALDDRGIMLTNTPGANSDAVADHAIGLALALLRGTVSADRRARIGDWTGTRGRELGQLAVGIAGFGRIGRCVAARLNGFGSRVLAFDPFVQAESVPRDIELVGTILELAERSDMVSLHLPGGHTVVNADWFAAARSPSYLINTARGDLIDETAVVHALRDGHLAGFAADTLSNEGEGANSPLLDAEFESQVVITPHLGAQTIDAIDRMSSGAAEAVLEVLNGRIPSTLLKLEGPR